MSDISFFPIVTNGANCVEICRTSDFVIEFFYFFRPQIFFLSIFFQTMNQPDLADLLYLTAIMLEFISLTWTSKRPFQFNSYRPSFKFETPTFLTCANPDQYYYNIVNGRPTGKAYSPPPMNKTRKPNQFLCYNCRQYGHYAVECTFSYVSKFEQNSDPNSTESLDISSEEQDLYYGKSYYEYDSDDEESEETEEESDSKFYGQEAFH
ncbi:hypothetical protein C2G38_910017 [Gigaspora rosea]|uniref:CCHC-type domain-containing protein n=1 Tax=Gigaspora rosea TaxID=44941 RepID=A0A397VKQ5_9GLOM|nr:hypothetical protein C2G38_910017 [Gigaspora rosea]